MSNEMQNNQNLLSPELVGKLLAVQEKDLALKAQEMELRKQTDSNSFEFAKASLTANIKDREEQRKYFQSITKYVLGFSAVVFLLFAVFLSIALYLNKDQIAMEIVKAIIYIASGGLGGYALGQRSGKESK